MTKSLVQSLACLTDHSGRSSYDNTQTSEWLSLRLSDLVGADIGMHVGKNFVEAFPDRVYVTQLMTLMNKHKRLGEKTGKGFYKVCALQWYQEML